MYGYLGHKKDKNFVLTVDTVTHRTDPWVMNSFTGVVQEYITAPQRAACIGTPAPRSPSGRGAGPPSPGKPGRYDERKT